ncbi:L-glutamate gamma-semialdehyde dehydrogenase [Terrabacter sp. GCM10028922]|uniref:L-glutamate gamma-semialdehyde dehydrogenase n=1 Tax=Terrabacter sp. GCM10028922 TaxID=3273428 RepID=UPI00361C793D
MSMSNHLPATVAGSIRITEPVNEPVRDYRPESPEAVALEAEIARVAGEVRELPHVVNGERLPVTDPVPVTAPHDHGHVLGHYSAVDDSVVDRAIEAALAARQDWSRTPWWDRAAVLLRAAELVSGKYRDELNATTMLGQSKTFHQAEIDSACETADFFRYNAHFAAQIYQTQPPSPAQELNFLDHRGLEGFVLSVTPFNFTAIGANLSTTPALMGNTVVWKPSEKAALSAQVLMKVFEEAGFPPGVINLVHGSGATVTERALGHERFAGLAFTGSTAIFRDLWKKTANNIDRYKSYPRVVGETGGKNAVVAHASADPDALLVALVRGAFEFQGQKCSAASRAYIPRSLWKSLEGRLAETVGQLKVGDPTQHETFMGAVIDEMSLRRLESTIEAAKELSGHRILTGGTVNTEQGWFVDPTIFVTEDPTSFLMEREFFGPLLAVHVYDDSDWDKVLHLVDTTSEYALTCSIFANDRAAVGSALSALRDTAGMTYVNDKPTGALIGRQSFGGGRGSGTNDKAGSPLALQRWVNARFVKENFHPPYDWTYPYMGQ